MLLEDFEGGLGCCGF